ncbi:MAG: DUF1800 family protein [Aquabacterium sp.]
MSNALQAAIAAHRFGLGEPDIGTIGGDARGWLLAQIGPADPQRGRNLPDAATALRRQIDFQRRFAQPPAAMAAQGMNPATDNRPVEQQFVEHFRDHVQADMRARLATAASTQRPFAERLALFWSNHFTVSIAKASARGMAGAFEREAIRPHIAGRFVDLLKASSTHASMLRYLDNHISAGPNSRFVQRRAARSADSDRGPRITGLNENLAREILELHTLGVSGGYAQADVTAFAAVLTGWRVAAGPMERVDSGNPTRFEPSWHEPGPKTVLGRTYREGADALPQLLDDLARHPSTARFIATKLARHFIADDPPATLVDQLAGAFSRSDGDLPTVYRTLLDAPSSWLPQQPKLKTPEEFVLSSARLLGLGERVSARAPDAGLNGLGQRLQAAPSPAGWPDQAEEWLGPEAVWKRVEMASLLGDRLGRSIDARALAPRSLGPLLTTATAQALDRAADGPQALTLLLLAPEFQRR